MIKRTERRPAFVFVIRHLKKATFAFVKRRYRFVQVARKCSLQI